MKWAILILSAVLAPNLFPNSIVSAGFLVQNVTVTETAGGLNLCLTVNNPEGLCSPTPAEPVNSCATNPIRDCSCFNDVKTDSSFQREIQPVPGGGKFTALCYPDIDGLIWTSILFREGQTPGSVSFDRTFADYENGFGAGPMPSGFYTADFFLGLKRLNALTKATKMRLKAILWDKDYNEYNVYYNTFAVSDAKSQYTLFLGSLNQSISDEGVMTLFHCDSDGQPFSARDKDNSQRCASKHKGGWWMRPKSYGTSCSNLNAHGPYDKSATGGTFGFDVNEVRVDAASIYFYLAPAK